MGKRLGKLRSFYTNNTVIPECIYARCCSFNFSLSRASKIHEYRQILPNKSHYVLSQQNFDFLLNTTERVGPLMGKKVTHFIYTINEPRSA